MSINENLFVDLHIHSQLSDGTLTADEICSRALYNNVAVIAISDHNTIKGVKYNLETAKRYGLYSIPAVEIDSIYNSKRCHILAYCFEQNNGEFSSFIENNKVILETTDYYTLKNISTDYKIELDQYDSFVFNCNLGGWKLIQFLINQDVAADLDEAIKIMKQYKHKALFPDAKTVINQIHNAGGIAVLAHPGETFHVTNVGNEEIDRYIKQLIEWGIDGIECFYPSHKSAFETYLCEICKENDMYTTVGSDYHGDFFKKSKQMIGCEFKRLKDLNLKNLFKMWDK